MKNPRVAKDRKPKAMDKNRSEYMNCAETIAYMRSLAMGDTDDNPLPSEKEVIVGEKMSAEDKTATAGNVKICRACRKEKDLSSCFEKNDKMKDGFINTCKQCRALQAIERKKLKSTQKPTTPHAPEQPFENRFFPLGRPTAPPGPDALQSEPISGKPMVLLDFGDYQDLYERVKKQATDDFRDVGNQILFMLKIELDKQGGRNAQQ